MKPIIAVSSADRMIEAINGFQVSNSTVSNKVIDKIFEYGAQPIVIPNGTCLDEGFWHKIDGLLLIPGQDISSELYGETLRIEYADNIHVPGQKYKRPSVYQPDQSRDRTELALCQTAYKKNIPIMGMCRGMQMINIALGGTLLQEIEENEITHNIGYDGWIHYHELTIREGTLFHTLMNQSHISISSVHHQAIQRLGEGLIASACTEDGIIEVIESEKKYPFILGIQGHFEFLDHNYKQYAAVWESFINSAKEYRDERERN